MASTHESDGYPGTAQKPNPNLVRKGPTGTERCGRAASSRVQNQMAFNGFPAPAWRMLDGDGFFVTLPVSLRQQMQQQGGQLAGRPLAAVVSPPGAATGLPGPGRYC